MERDLVRRVALVVGQDVTFCRNVIRGVRAYAIDKPHWLFRNGPPDTATVRACRQWQPDGIIAHLGAWPLAKQILRLGKPVVDIACMLPKVGVPVVDVDHRAVGRLAAEYFLNRGFRNFGFYGSREAYYCRLREQSFTERLAEAGCSVSACYGEYLPDMPGARRWQGQDQRVQRWLLDLPKPAAILASNDIPARYLADQCRQVGLRVPDEVALLGVDDDEFECTLCSPPLSSVAIPSEQIGWEAARRIQCANNLKQLGLACQLYAQQWGVLPPNGAVCGAYCPDHWYYPSLDDRMKGGYLIRILPYIEQQALYDKINFTRNPELYSFVVEPDQPVYKQVISTFFCPSNRRLFYWPGGGLDKREGALGHYGMNVGNAQSFRCSEGGNYWGRNIPNNLFHGDSMDPSKVSGPFSSMFWSASFSDIRDGTSNTIAMGEARPECSSHLRDGWMHINSMWLMTTPPINYPTCPGEPGYTTDPNQCHNEETYGKACGFKSLHPGGAQFVFCDGSVRFLTEGIDYVTYQKLGDRWDGLPIEANY